MTKRADIAQHPSRRFDAEREAQDSTDKTCAPARKPYAAPLVAKRRSVKHATLVSGNQSQGVGSSGNF